MKDRFVGCMLGLALGDAMAAPYEGGVLERAVWALLSVGKGLVWSDDTQMSMALAGSLIRNGRVEQHDLAASWAQAMEWRRGYGPGVAKLLKKVRAGEDWRAANRAVFPDGSFGNGAAMRAAPVGLFYHRKPDLIRFEAERSAEITNAHPLGMEGAVLIAHAAAMALTGRLDLGSLREGCRLEEYSTRLEAARELLSGEPSLDEVRERLGSSVKAQESVVTAVYAFCRFQGRFEPMVEFIISLGGDTDTIAAMAGALFGAANGVRALPQDKLARLDACGELEALGAGLFRACPSG